MIRRDAQAFAPARVGLVEAGPTAVLAYEVHGSGIPLIAVHGAYSSRIETRGFLEPILERYPIRRVYVDLPGHGGSRPSSGLSLPDEVLDLVDRLLEEEAPEGPFLLVGHSFGGHFARAIAARHPHRVAGLALVCAIVPGDQRLPPQSVVRDDGVSAQLGDDEREAFESYFVVRTAETLARFRAVVAPASGDVDEDTVGTAVETGPHRIDPDSVVIEAPVLVVSARHDHWVGWERQERLGDRSPRATVATLADAGHALPHECPELFGALMEDWLRRVEG
ncbi:alpha/beta fold hydrolase [Microbacterium sp. P04]|uniref:alpha/beta fold hydrolase n=1 Tax=Microbacterium sp. P04 TaxID=3366947 RepID=UPI0037456BFD